MLDAERVAYSTLFPHRSSRLFTEFLPTGYEMMTLSSVDPGFRERLSVAKLALGMLITLYDDLADHPVFSNSKLLHELYKLPFHAESVRLSRLSPHDRKVVKLAKGLADQTFPILVSLPHFNLLAPVLRFDLNQFFNANRFSELVTQSPFLANAGEGSHYINHNMGMMIIGTMDLMGSSKLKVGEMGRIRSVFTQGQRIGRISNVVSTLRRELKEGDVTNELVMAAIEAGEVSIDEVRSGALGEARLGERRIALVAEREKLFGELAENTTVKTFSVAAYVKGLRGLVRLHERLEGVI